MLGRKKNLSFMIKKFQRFWPTDFDFMPKSFVLPEENKPLKNYLEAQDGNAMMIAKPSRGAQGTGIFLVRNYGDKLTHGPSVYAIKR